MLLYPEDHAISVATQLSEISDVANLLDFIPHLIRNQPGYFMEEIEPGNIVHGGTLRMCSSEHCATISANREWSLWLLRSLWPRLV